MLNLRENIKRLHLNQHQIETNMSAQFQILKNKIKKSNIHNFTVNTQRLMDYCVLNS